MYKTHLFWDKKEELTQKQVSVSYTNEISTIGMRHKGIVFHRYKKGTQKHISVSDTETSFRLIP